MIKHSENNYSFFYEVATFIMLIKMILSYSTILTVPNIYDNILSLFFTIIILIKIWNQKLLLKELTFFLFLGILVLYTSLVTRDFYIVMTYLGIIAIKEVNIKKVLKILYRTKFFAIFLHVLVFLFDFMNGTAEAIYRYGEELPRYSLNFSHPNVSSMLIIWAIFEYIYVNYEKTNIVKLLFLLIAYIPLHLLNNSKTSLIIYFIVMLTIIIKKSSNTKVINTFITFFAKFGFSISALISIVSVVLYENNILFELISKFDNLITGRIRLGAKTLSMYGYSLMGQYIDPNINIIWDEFYKVDSIVLDSFYIKYFLNNGFMYLIIIGFLLYKFSFLLSNKDKVFIVALILYGVTENYIINIFLCFPLMIVANRYYNYSENKKLNKYSSLEFENAATQ